MKYNITQSLIGVLICIPLFRGCAHIHKVNDHETSKSWEAVQVDSIPQLKAVELPLDSQMVSSKLLKKINAGQRIKMTPEVVMAFESNSPLGLLNPDNQYKQTTARQFSAYCTAENKIVLIYNFVFIGYESCNYLKDKWKREVVMDSECTDIGVFKTNIECPPEN